MASTSGMPKAPVLPLPVMAWTIRSPPARIFGMAAAWTGVQEIGGKERAPHLQELNTQRLWRGRGPAVRESLIDLGLAQLHLSGLGMMIEAHGLFVGLAFGPRRAFMPEAKDDIDGDADQKKGCDDRGGEQQTGDNNRSSGQAAKEVAELAAHQISTTKSSASSALSLIQSFSCCSVSSSISS